MRILINYQPVNVESIQVKYHQQPIKRHKGAYGTIGFSQAKPDIDLQVAFADSKQADQFQTLAARGFSVQWTEPDGRFLATGCVLLDCGDFRATVMTEKVIEI